MPTRSSETSRAIQSSAPTLDCGRLIVINREKLPDGALDFIRKHGKAIADHLVRKGEFDERAAIIEFDGGLKRGDAEDLASILLAATPDGCDPADWTWFVSKAAEIIDANRRSA